MRIRELVRNALRMRPDRIIVGEVRGAETLDMLQAMNTGHEGSLTTIHANSPRDALSRLETLVLTAGVDLPLRAIREQISSAFDLLVQISRLVDGSRRITHVTEVLADGVRRDHAAGHLRREAAGRGGAAAGQRRACSRRSSCTGLKPHFLEKIAANGVVLPPTFFERRTRAAVRVRQLSRGGFGGALDDPASAPASSLVAALALARAGGRGRPASSRRGRHERLPDDPRYAWSRRAAPRAPGRCRERAAGRRARGGEPRPREERRARDRPLAVDGGRPARRRARGGTGVRRREAGRRPRRGRRLRSPRPIG